jgi:hypothetical protein
MINCITGVIFQLKFDKAKGSSLLLTLVGFKQSFELPAALPIALLDALVNEIVFLMQREQMQEWEYKLVKSQEQT